MNTLKLFIIYLPGTWWRQNYDNLHIAKVYFTELHVEIQYVKCEDNIMMKTLRNVKFFRRNNIKIIKLLTIWKIIRKKRTLNNCLQELQTIGLTKCTAWGGQSYNVRILSVGYLVHFK